MWVFAVQKGRGVEIDMKKAKHYYELAALNGSLYARYNLGNLEGRAGNHRRSMKHFLIAGRAGFTESLSMIKQGFMKGYVTKEEYTTTLRAYQKRKDDMKSDMRDKALAHSLAPRAGGFH